MAHTYEEIRHYFRTDPEALKVLATVRDYFPALERNQDVPDLLDKFMDAVANKGWTTANRLMWPYMTEDEKDKISWAVLNDARKAVAMMHLGEKILKQVVVKLITYALQ